MKKIMIALVISFVLCVVLGVIASNGLNYGVLEKTYNYNSSDMLLDENSKLSLLSYDYNGVNYGVLGFNNKNLTINDNGSVSSYIVGKNCLSIMANIFDINTNVNKLGLELSEEELKSLNDYLPTLLNILSIPVEEVKYL